MDLMAEGEFVAGAGTTIESGALVGQRYDGWRRPTRLGEDCTIRTGTVVYADVVLGDGTSTGVHSLIREHTHMGREGVVGSGTIIENGVRLGDHVILQSGVFLPAGTLVGNRVFVGPRAVFTNDRYPLRRREQYLVEGPVLEDDVSVGANVTLLPGVQIGRGAMVAAGSVVTKDVPPWTLAVGSPARFRDLPDRLQQPNSVRRRA